MYSYLIHYEDTSTQTYTFTDVKPRYVDINNTGASDLTFQTSTMATAMTLPAGQSIYDVDFGLYSSITITATSSFIFIASTVFKAQGV